MRHLIAITLFCLPLFTFSQAQIKGKVVADESGNPLSGANIVSVGNSINGTSTNQNGVFEITISNQQWQNATLKITYLGYDSIYVKISEFWEKNTDVPTFKLKSKSFQLGDATVRAPLPDTVHGSRIYSIEDYAFVEDDLLLMTYEKTLKRGAELRLIDGETDEQKSKYFLPTTPKKFIRDYRGVLNLEMENGKIFQVDIEKDQILLSDVDEEQFKGRILPVLDSMDHALYFSTFQESYPAVDYMAYDLGEKGYFKMKTIEDEVMMEMYRAEYKYMDVRTKLWAFQQEVNTGIDKEIWVGANIFTQSPYYEEIYAPLFFVNDTIYVFDHYSDMMFKYKDYNTPIDSLAITYHKKEHKTGWDKLLLQDFDKDDIYIVYYKHSITNLKKFNPTNGKIEGTFELHFKYAENHKIKDGYVYYIYHPFESPQKKFLYREEIAY